jgi:TonB-linked SusC/RagA family outer membrane protein
MRKLVSMTIVLMMCALHLFAQEKTVTGKVTDETGAPIANVSIIVKGTTVGTTSKEDGSYSLRVPATGRVLIFSAVNMSTTEISIGNRTEISLAMESYNKSLEEVVVVGYGSGKRKENVAGSLTKLSGDVVENRPTANMIDALQGRVGGLQVYNGSGEPSATPTVRLHGVGSLGASNTPLYVLDGIPVGAGSIVSLNPNDIETITVLKDPSTTAIYGSRAANGVILYTTKKGRSSAPQINVSAQYGVSNLVETTEKNFSQVMNTKQLTDFWVATGYRTQAQVNATLAAFPNDTRWYKTYYRSNLPTFQADLNMSGGGGKTTYYVSGGYFKQDGLAYRSIFERYTFRSNIQSAVTDWLKFGLNLSGGFDKRQTNPYGSNSTNRGLALLAQPFYSPNDPTGKPYPNLIPGWGRYNPEYLANNIRSDGKNGQFNPMAYAELSPIKGLILRTQAGMDAYDYTTSNVQLPSYLGSLNNGNASESFERGTLSTITNTVEYKFSLPREHDFTVLAGQEYIKGKTIGFNGSSTGQTDDRLLLVGAGPNNRNAGSSLTEYAYQSFFGRLNYGWKSKYLIDLSVRQDQSSRFGRDNRIANFWSAGVLWKAKNEDFLADIGWVNDLSVRASYGTSGNSSIGNYDNLATVSNGIYNGETTFGISAAGNPNLGWESQAQTSIGVEASLFKVINLKVDYYIRETSNQLFDVPFPFTSGFGSILDNVGAIKNTGVDVELSVNALSKKNGFITPWASFNYNKNEITELFQGRNYWVIPNTGISYVIGQPVTYLYPIWAGVNSQNGLPQWYLPDPNPDNFVNPTKDQSRVTSTFNSAVLQQSTGIQRYAPINGGFGLDAGFKGFYMNANFAYSLGKYMINNDDYFFMNPTQFAGFNQSTAILDYWKKAGDVTRFPRYDGTTLFTQFDSRLIQNASFMRLKGLTIGYSVPKNLLQRAKFIKGADFSVTGRNLWTVTKYTGPDPEVDTNVSLGANPNTKQIVVGISFKF